MYTFLWSFFILSFVGWIGEVAFAAIVEKRFVNRGFLNGPLCPIYGIGAVFMYLLLGSIDGVMLLFLGSMLIGSAVEWIAGFLLEKIFHQKWWDYSNLPYNLNGYICLGFSVFWGMAGLFAVRYLMPTLISLIDLIPLPLGIIILVIFMVVALSDLILTVFSAIGLQKHLQKLDTLSASMKLGSDLIGKAVSDKVLIARDTYDKLELKEKYDEFSDKATSEIQELKDKYQKVLQSLNENRWQTRLIKAFPRASSHLYNDQLHQIQNTLDILSKKSSGLMQKREKLAESAYNLHLEPGEPKPFAHGISFTKLFWVFMIGNVIGFLVETFWCLLSPPHEFQLRVSVVIGPFVLVYGFGAVILTLLLHRFYHKKSFYLFLVSMLTGAYFEYFCSWFQEVIFGSVSWDYTNSTLNLGGRTNLMYSFFWGILGMVWIKDVYPRISLLIEKAPKKIGNIVTIFTVIFMCFDILLSAGAVYRQKQRLQDISATSRVQVFLDKHFDDEFLETRYANMKFLV
ncbi:putative ABC transporter permease [Scatolibacter rhodanostii]|uniref:putative ABC transporter permease n=1 Tax=Scatolibacter rhodanostii TaxID=2014781 RepID=UPI000C0799C6|nr:hypothetical protein [Scatolibacter rhodanostii]